MQHTIRILAKGFHGLNSDFPFPIVSRRIVLERRNTMELVFFIIPSVFLLIGICYCLFLTFGIPQDSVLQLNWGALHTGDFLRMTE